MGFYSRSNIRKTSIIVGQRKVNLIPVLTLAFMDLGGIST